MEKQKKIVKCVIDEAGDIGIQAMGLVDFPAIEQNWIALSKLKLAAVSTERRMLYGPALIPDKHILRINEKTGEEYYVFFDAQTVTALAHQFFKKNLHHTTNLQHAIPVTGVTVVESWIKEGPMDKSVELGLADAPNGTWFIGTKVDSDSVWEQVKQNNINGYSIEGIFQEVSVNMTKNIYQEKTFEAELFQELDKLLSLMV